MTKLGNGNLFSLLLLAGTLVCSPRALAASSYTDAADAALRAVYFPDTEFRDFDGAEFYVPGFAADLKSLEEPSLINRQDLSFAVRITWLSSFEGRRVLRIEQDKHMRLIARFKLQFPTGNDTPPDLSVADLFVSPKDMPAMLAIIQNVGFFALSNKQDVVATDGTAMLVEIVYRGRYHAVYKVIPFADPLQKIAAVAARIAHVRIDLER